jgi:hypothetical protein
MTGLSIIVASAGRGSLPSAISTIVHQMAPGDELLLDVNLDSPYGNTARNRMMRRAREGNGLVFFDDDDRVMPDGLHHMREAYVHDSDRMHIFKMHFNSWILWTDPEVRKSNVSTQMVCVPASWAVFSKWGDRYEGDFDFIRGLADHFGEESIVWHSEIVATHNGLRSLV